MNSDAFEAAIKQMLELTKNDPLAVFTALLALATFMLVWVVFCQVRDARRSAQRQLRAYVHVTEAQFADFATQGIYMINYRNTGQTPTYDVASDIAVQFTKFPLVEPLDVRGTGKKGVSTLGRDCEGHARLEAPRALSAKEYDSVRMGESAVFVYGSITYRDIFGDRWATKYRYYIGGDQGIRADGFMAGHPEGNEAT